MSTRRDAEIACPHCGLGQTVLAYESANADRHPPVRAEILARTFMTFRCRRCHRPFAWERELLYAHLSAGLLVLVAPGARRSEPAAIEALEAAVTAIRQDQLGPEVPPPIRAVAERTLTRVVFGYEELREKVVALGAGLDDQALEVLKLDLLARAAQGPGNTLQLESVEPDGPDAALSLTEYAPDGRMLGTHRLARARYEAVLARRADWLVPLAGLLRGPYVNARRSAAAGPAAG